MLDPGVFQKKKNSYSKGRKATRTAEVRVTNRAKEGKQGICRNNSHANLLAFVETKNSNLEGKKYSKEKKRLTG